METTYTTESGAFFPAGTNLWCSDVILNQPQVGDTDPNVLNEVSLYALVAADHSIQTGNLSFLSGVTDANPYGMTVDVPVMSGTFTPCMTDCGPLVVGRDTQTKLGSVSLSFSGQFSGSWMFDLVKHRIVGVGGRGGGIRISWTEMGMLTVVC